MTLGLVVCTLRENARHPWQVGLALLGIAVGVGSVVAIDLASLRAHRAFEASNRAVMGVATHSVTGERGVPAALLPLLVALDPSIAAAPVVTVRARAVLADGREAPVTLLGVDPVSERALGRYRSLAGAGRDGGPRPAAESLVSSRAAALATAAAARQLGLRVGDRFELSVGRERRGLELAGLLEPASEVDAAGLDETIVQDVRVAAERAYGFGSATMPVRYDRIDIRLPTGRLGDALARRIRTHLGPGVTLAAVGVRASAAHEMTRAFELNLRMLGLLSLAVGMLLIYNAMTFAVARRRTLIGTLRALGVTRGEVVAALLLEAAGLGLLGSVLGLAAGTALAGALTEMVVRTLSDLYFATEVRGGGDVAADPSIALGLGVGTAILAAAFPALQAAGVPPRLALLRSAGARPSRRAMVRMSLFGAAAIGIAGLVLAGSTTALAPGYLALLGVLVGSVCLVPAAAAGLLHAGAAAARVLPGAGAVVWRSGLRGIQANLGRTSVAIAAFTIALAATVGVSVMVDSFRHAVHDWLRGTLRADLYVSTRGETDHGEVRPAPLLDAALVERLRGVPGIAGISRGRWVRVDAAGGSLQLLVWSPPENGPPAERSRGTGFALIAGDPERAWPAFFRGEAVLVSEPFAFHGGFGVGDRIELAGEVGSVPIAGVFRDYRSERGFVLVHRRLFDRAWPGSPGYTALGVYLDAAARTRVEAVRTELAASLREAGFDTADVRDDASLREASMAVFERTFAVTGVLRSLAVAVAFVAVLSALLASELDRRRERAVLRALGLTRGQLLAVAEAEAMTTGLLAGLLSLPVGVGLAAILVSVINRRSFGWSMDLGIEPGPLLASLGIGLGAAALAGLYPAWRVARSAPADALREE